MKYKIYIKEDWNINLSDYNSFGLPISIWETNLENIPEIEVLLRADWKNTVPIFHISSDNSFKNFRMILMDEKYKITSPDCPGIMVVCLRKFYLELSKLINRYEYYDQLTTQEKQYYTDFLNKIKDED